MALYLCDTSALVAAVSTWHERHDRTGRNYNVEPTPVRS